jgi:integrase/recombinase XerD
LEALQRPDLERFVRDLMAEGRSPRSVARDGGVRRGFYRFLVIDGRCRRAPPTISIRRGPGRCCPTYLSVDEVDALIAQPDVSDARGLRDRALIELLYATGLRVSELMGLRAGRLEPRGVFPHVHGQGRQAARGSDRRRSGALGDPVPARRPHRPPGAPNEPTLFVNARGGGAGLTRVGFWKILKGYARMAGLKTVAQPTHAAPLVCPRICSSEAPICGPSR